MTATPNPYASPHDSPHEVSSSRRFPRRLLTGIAASVVIIMVACAGLYSLGKSVKISVGYGNRAQFAEYPPDDSALELWINEQPGCFKAGIDRDPDAIRVYWIMSRDLFGNPQPPEIKSQFERLGYRGLINFDPDWLDG